MAVSLEAAFILLDKASGPLKDIQKQAEKTDKALRDLGGGNLGQSGWTQQYKAVSAGIGEISTATKDLTAKTKDAKAAIDETVKATDKAGTDGVRNFARLRSATEAVANAVGGLWRGIKNLVPDLSGVKRVFSDLGDALSPLAPALQGIAAAGAGAVGAIGGMASALPPLVWAATLAAPAIIALAGAVGALAASLGAAVGGAAIIGGGLMASFAVGLGGIAFVAKQSMGDVKKYDKALQALNKSIASGNQAAIKRNQLALDKIVKSDPGVVKLSQSMKELSKQWNKVSGPATSKVQGLMADMITSLSRLLPTLAESINRSATAVKSGFEKILAPFLNSKGFKSMILELTNIFTANVPGIMRGLVSLFDAFHNILKVATPTLKEFGGGFAGMMAKFDQWTKSKNGKQFIGEMITAFKEWLRLIGGVLKVLMAFIGAASGSGTSIVAQWATDLNRLAASMNTKDGKQDIATWIHGAIKTAGDVMTVLVNIGKAMVGFLPVLTTVSNLVMPVLKSISPQMMIAAFLGFVGIKGAIGGIKTVRSIMAPKGTSKDPLWVKVINQLGGNNPWDKNKKPGEGRTTAHDTSARTTASHTTAAHSTTTSTHPSTHSAEASAAATAAGRAGVAERALGRGAMRVPGAGIKTVNAASKLGGAFDTLGRALGKFGIPLAAIFGAATAGGNIPNRVLGAARSVTSIPQGFAGMGADILHGLGLPTLGLGTIAKIPSGVDLLASLFKSGGTGPQPINYNQGGAAYLSGARAVGARGANGQTIATAAGTNGISSGGSLAGTLKHIVTGAGVSITQALQGLGNPLSPLHKHFTDFTGRLGPDFNKPVQTAAATAKGHLADLQAKGQGSLQTLHDKGSAIMQDQSKNLATEAGRQAATIDQLGRAVGTGLKNIQDQVNAALRAFGVGTVSAVTNVANKVTGVLGLPPSPTTGTTGGVPKKHAQGGRLPGPPRGDHIPLYSRGGGLMGIADGGELIVNRHTEARQNAINLAVGAPPLGQLVAGETRKHFATGGRASGVFTASQFGGPSDPGTGSTGYRGDNLHSKPDSFAELNMGTALGNLAYQTPINLGYNGKMMTLYKRDIGAGGPGLGGHVRAVDVWYEAAQKLGLPGLANVSVNSGSGTPVGGGGGGASVPQVAKPGIKGPGLLGVLGNAIMSAATSTAQAFINSKAPVATVGTGGGGGPAPMTGPAAVQAMIAKANEIASHNYAYEWGGGHGAVGVPSHGSGHGSGPGVGFDCSGAVSAVLHAAGLANQPYVASAYMSFGQPGPGSNVSVWASPSHTFMSLNGHYFGTSGQNPGGGANWIPSFPGNIGGPRHPAGFATGGRMNELNQLERTVYEQYGKLMPGMAQGGRIPWYGKGTDFIAKRPQIIGVGDGGPERVTVTPHAQAPASRGVSIGQMVIQNHRPGDVREQVKREVSQAFDDLAKQIDGLSMEDTDRVLTG